MNNFSVEPANIEGFAKLVDRAAGDTHAAKSYMLRNSTISDAMGELWQKVFGPHQERLAEAERALRNFERILDDSSIELKKVAQHYRETDREVAAHLDATGPGTDGWRDYIDTERPNAGDFTDAADPTAHLRVPGGADGYLRGHVSEFEFAPMHKSLGTIMDLGSPSALAAEGIKAVFGFDIFGTVTKWIAGDWDSYANCADVWDNLGKFCADLSLNRVYANFVAEKISEQSVEVPTVKVVGICFVFSRGMFASAAGSARYAFVVSLSFESDVSVRGAWIWALGS